jgi:GNAT superfamily N-acetyltransferase
MNDARDAARLIAATVHRAFGPLDDRVTTALINEHVATLCERDAPSWHVARIRDRDLLLVHDGARAWIAAWAAADIANAREEGWALGSPIERVIAGGPPGGYVVSGVTADDLAWFEREGFVKRAAHVDLRVRSNRQHARDPRVRRARIDETDAVAAWISSAFAPAWAREARRSLRMHDALFVAERDGAYVGFCAHSGHNAAIGTFGPLGVDVSERGRGLGAALARAALDDLHARGHGEVTIPWVDTVRVAFYRALVDEARVEARSTVSTR